MDESVVLRTQNLTKAYGSKQVLFDVDLTVKRGEIVGFLGSNGAGKTTAIRCLLDLIHRDGGEVSVMGLDPAVDPVGVRRQVGYLPGELHLDEGMNARGQLKFFASLRGQALDETRLNTLAERLEMDLKESIRNLSKGNKQKVGLLNALLHDAPLLIMDEPTDGLDPLMQHEVLAILRELREQGTTIFFSSHVLPEVQAIAERVVVIQRGRIARVTTVNELSKGAITELVVQFEHSPAPEEFKKVEGVRAVVRQGEDRLQISLEGSIDALLKALAQYRVIRLETRQPSLEDMFMDMFNGKEAS